MPEPSASTKRNLLTAAKGGGIILGGKLFNHGGRLLTAIVVARFLAADQYGEYNLGLTTAEVLAGFASLGLHKALVRYIPISVREGDRAGLWGTLQLCVGLNGAISLVFGIGLFAMAEPVANGIFHDPQVEPLLRLISLFVPFFALNDGLAAATRGFKNFHYTAISQFLTHPIVKFVLTMVFAIFGLTALRALTAAGIAEMATFGMLLYFLQKQVRQHPTDESRRDVGEVLRYSIPLYFSQLLNEFSGRFQVLFLGTLSTSRDVGVYVVARQLTTVSALFQRAVRVTGEPIMAELINSNKKSKANQSEFKTVYQNLTKWTFALNLPILLVLVLLAKPILSLFGESFSEGVALIWLFAPRRLIYVATGMCGAALDMGGHSVLRLMNSAIGVVLLLSLNFWLIPLWGSFGAAVAVTAAEVTVSLLQLIEIAVLHHVLPFGADFLKPVLAAAIAIATSLTAGQWFPPEASYWFVAANALLIVGSYAVAILALGLNPEERFLLSRARGRARALVSRVPVFANAF
jgi:O-antigen/teichoic acid export membrane protein